MALQITSVKRSFTIPAANGKAQVILEDINPALTPVEVLNFYSNAYPELTTATIDGPKMTEDGAKYEFKRTVGTKG